MSEERRIAPQDAPASKTGGVITSDEAGHPARRDRSRIIVMMLAATNALAVVGFMPPWRDSVSPDIGCIDG
ncbi:MAG: hypothetical protein WAM92_11530 [Mycobacterium sp.]